MDFNWLLLLICPLMMIPMMYFMMKGNHSEQGNNDGQKHLAKELEILRKQNESMQNEIRNMKNNA
jgi:hypothetical protein